jgi:hypothetical protein
LLWDQNDATQPIFDPKSGGSKADMRVSDGSPGSSGIDRSDGLISLGDGVGLGSDSGLLGLTGERNNMAWAGLVNQQPSYVTTSGQDGINMGVGRR